MGGNEDRPAQVLFGKGAVLSAGAVAISETLFRGRAERSIKPFVMGRKNWLFANTEGGAQSSAIVYSLIETARENNLDPYRYLVHVFSKAPGLAVTDKNWAAKLLPENIPPECCITKK